MPKTPSTVTRSNTPRRGARPAVPLVAVAWLTVTALPALAQDGGGESARPWHFWIAPILLAGAVLSLIALGVGYYVRVMSGRGRR